MSAPRFVRGDLDGFFGLFIDNLLNLMMITALCTSPLVGLPPELVTGKILPGAAISILVGNLFYARQARDLMRKTGRDDVTALPYGINTPSMFAYIFLIMAPVYQQTKNPTLAWQAGLFGCLLSGVIEAAGAFCGDWLRRSAPRAALLSALAGIAITFISMSFVFRIFASPAITLVPMLLLLVTYASRVRLPLGLPGGLVAVLVGVVLAWTLRAAGQPFFEPDPKPYTFALYLPQFVPADALALLTSETGWRYLAVIFPMGLFNAVGSLQNLESAEAAGDRYETRPSLLVNGIGSIVAALFGSAFPTTIYIGHPAWKAMGARAAYSSINGLVITGLALVGGIGLLLKVIPLEATVGILLWIGIIMAAQAFQEVPRRHALAVALGLLPALAAWALTLIETSLQVAGSNLLAQVEALGERDLHLHGIIALSQGFLLTSMVLAAVLVFLIDREFLKAAAWTAGAAILSMLGLIHAYDLTEAGVRNRFGLAAAPWFGAMYALGALLLVVVHFTHRTIDAPAPAEKEVDPPRAHEPPK